MKNNRKINFNKVYKIAIIFHYFYHHFSLFYHYLNKSWSDDATGNELPPSAAASSLLGPCPGRKVAQTVTALPPQASHAAFRVRAFQCRRSVCRQATVPLPSRCPSESPSVTVTQPQRRPHTGSADRSRLAPRRLGKANLKPGALGPPAPPSTPSTAPSRRAGARPARAGASAAGAARVRPRASSASPPAALGHDPSSQLPRQRRAGPRRPRPRRRSPSAGGPAIH